MSNEPEKLDDKKPADQPPFKLEDDRYGDSFDDDYDDENGYERDEWDEDEAALEECGQWPGGGCQLAGTEFCDFDCPYRDIDLFAKD